MKFNRRALLINAMGGGLFLPSLLGDRLAYGAVPKRLMIFHTQHGPNYWDWSMRPPGSGDAKTADWESSLANLAESAWSAVLKPLYKHRNDLLVLDGLANTAAFAGPGTNNHNAGNAAMLTGAKTVLPGGFNNEGTGGGPSVDQVIGDFAKVDGRKATLMATTSGAWSPIFSGPSAELKGPTSPASLYLQVKGWHGALLGGGGTAPAPAPADIDKVALARTTLPDLLRPEYDSLLQKLSNDDKIKLEGHLALMNDLQKQLVAQTPSGAPPPAGGTGGTTSGSTLACDFVKPAQPTAVLPVVDEHLKIMVMALACQVTNVSVVVAGQLSGTEIGGGSLDVHQDIAHASTTPGSKAAGLMRDYYVKHALQFSQLLDQMKAIPEGSGTLLDNTIVMWNTQLANGPHEMYRHFTLLAGGGQGYLKPGRYVKYKETEPNPASYTYGGGKNLLGPANNKLLVSMMEYMGLPNQTIGVSSASGKLAGTGQPCDLKGPLRNLRP